MAENTEGDTTQSAEQAAQRTQHIDRIFEVVSAFMLGVVALTTAWSGYQAARWSGVQAANYNQASTARVQASQFANQAGQLTAIDISVFSNWVNAYAEGNQELADFYQKRFRAEFVPAFDAWVATKPRSNPDAPSTPFAMPQYQVQAKEDAAKLEAQANDLFQQGQVANDVSDQYILITVILASVLFFLAIAERFDWFRIRLVIILIALGLLLFALGNLVTYPIG